jgi:tRNA (guanine-N7-)-methyltransferase
MKLTDLKYPFSWEERKPAIHARVLFVPKHYTEHSQWNFPGWEDPQLFGKKGKVFIEFCSGNGAWVAHKASAKPDELWLAVEQKFERVRKIWLKGQKQALSNLFVICGEARTFATHYLPEGSIDGVFINFPDPWPKTKHAKNRLIQAPFVAELARIMQVGGEAVFATDDIPYATQIQEEMRQNPAFTPKFPDPYFVTEWPDYGASYFDSLWRGKGKTIHYLVFKKRAVPC